MPSLGVLVEETLIASVHIRDGSQFITPWVSLIAALLSDTLYSIGLVDGSYFPTKWARIACVQRLRTITGILACLLMWAGAFFTVAKYGLGVNSEELYRYKGAYGTVKPLPSRAITESCTEMMQSRCPFEAADIGNHSAPLWEKEGVCSSCIVNNWEALARECTYDVDDDYYNDVPLRYNGTGVLDGLIVHCRTLCPKGVKLAHCTQAPSMFVQKDGFIFCLGIGLLWLSGTFFTAGCVYIDSPSGWFGFEACGEGRMGGNDGGIPNASSPLRLHLSGLLRAQASMWGQVCIWQSFWNFLEFYQPATFWREFSYVILGLLGFLSTRTFYPQSLYEPVNGRGYEFSENSEVMEGAEGQDSFGNTRSHAYTAGTSHAEQVESNNARHKRAGKGGSSLGAQLLPTNPAQLRGISQAPLVDKPTFGTALRALVSLLAQLTHLVGCWTILITYTDFIGPRNDYTKQALFAALGFALVAGSGTLTAMAGIEDPDPDDANHDPDAPLVHTPFHLQTKCCSIRRPIFPPSYSH
jgi:hypothetical protein